MTEESVQFLPFHAVNEFMNSEYRGRVIRSALEALPTLPEEYRLPIDRITRSTVKVPGFRNSAKAPVSLKVKPMAESFEKRPDLVAAILSAWAESRPELRRQVYDLLAGRGWEVLPPEADRTQLPGFLPSWPKDEDFEELNQAFNEKFLEADAESDDVSLMVVWVSGRLPYQVEGEEEE